METTSYIALSRQGALRREMDVIAHNLANMNSTAFKGEKMMFVEHLVKSRNDESFIPTKLAFTRDVAQYRNLEEGPIQTTGNTLNFAIRGDGYFTVEVEDGTQRYTRNGNFTIDPEGQLVTQTGNAVLAEGNAPVFLAPGDTEITVAADGTISTNNGPLGRFQIVRFEDEQRLEPEASGLLTSDDVPQEVENPHVLQGALEGSNIQPILELTNMIQVHRAYEGVKKIIESEDQRLKKMVDQLGQRA